jgi:hypothetical protein
LNERIRQLAEQAEKYADDNFKGEIFWTEAYESKFAELIVRECADYITEYYDSRDEAYYMKKHFGVEE